MWIWDNMILPPFASLFQKRSGLRALERMGTFFLLSLFGDAWNHLHPALSILLTGVCFTVRLCSWGFSSPSVATQYENLAQQKVFWCLFKWGAVGRCGLFPATLMSQEIGMVGSKVCILLKGWVKDCMEPHPHPTYLHFWTFFDGVLKEWRKSWLSETAQPLPHLKG